MKAKPSDPCRPAGVPDGNPPIRHTFDQDVTHILLTVAIWTYSMGLLFAADPVWNWEVP